MIDFFKDEKTLRICRRHWLVFLFITLNAAALFVVVAAAPFFINTGFILPEGVAATFAGYDRLIFLFSVLMLEIIWIIFFLIVADYYLDVWIVTDHRLIFIEIHGLFSRTVSSVHLRNIQDVSTDIRGILPTLFKFGSVRAQSAATQGEFIFKQVPEPNAVKDIILQAKERFLAEAGTGAHSDE